MLVINEYAGDSDLKMQTPIQDESHQKDIAGRKKFSIKDDSDLELTIECPNESIDEVATGSKRKFSNRKSSTQKK